MTTSGYPIHDSCECSDCTDLEEQEEAFEKYDPIDGEITSGRQWWLTLALERVRERRQANERRG